MYVTVTRYDRAAYEGIVHVTWQPPPQHPDHGSQADPVAPDPFANLGVSPSVSGQAFVIRVPTYARNLQILDRSGRVVNQTRTERGEFLWQGTDQQGRRLPEGIYFIKATGREKTEVEKILLVR